MKGVFEKKEHFGLMATRISGFRAFSPMFHPHGELILLEEGELRLSVDSERLTLRAGELAVIFPYLVHSYERSPEAKGILVLFDPSETAFDNTLLTHKPASARTDGGQIAALPERIVYHSRGGRIKTAFGYLNAVLGECLEKMPLKKSDRRSENNAVRVLAYCSEHFTEPLTVKSVSEALYVSQSYISKIFSEELRYGFREYLNSLRIQKAATLLRQTDKKIVEIMLDCGFQNQSSFNRVFRGETGVTPKEYRQAREWE
ncbi:MAG: helix-turn-helix transcriptional regulator [Clostridia bacterium]|nr:helix-turn-helix transcriptional regulator [Clostridia bacterium]